jgi:hypothetical protein
VCGGGGEWFGNSSCLLVPLHVDGKKIGDHGVIDSLSKICSWWTHLFQTGHNSTWEEDEDLWLSSTAWALGRHIGGVSSSRINVKKHAVSLIIYWAGHDSLKLKSD